MTEFFAGQMAVTCLGLKNPPKMSRNVSKLRVSFFNPKLNHMTTKKDTHKSDHFGVHFNEVTKCFARAGFKAVPFEINLQGSAGDILSPIGLLCWQCGCRDMC